MTVADLIRQGLTGEPLIAEAIRTGAARSRVDAEEQVYVETTGEGDTGPVDEGGGAVRKDWKKYDEDRKRYTLVIGGVTYKKGLTAKQAAGLIETARNHPSVRDAASPPRIETRLEKQAGGTLD